MKAPRLLRLAFVLLASSLFAQSPTPAPAPEAKQFDFWIGEWTVTAANGQVAGTNKIERVSNGHGLLENWTGARGGHGKSLNAYNAARKQWQQFWIGGDGMVLELAGGLDAQGRMAMTGQSYGRNEGLNRITWTPNADGTVRQFWEASKDGGRTWAAVFDGLYRKK